MVGGTWLNKKETGTNYTGFKISKRFTPPKFFFKRYSYRNCMENIRLCDRVAQSSMAESMLN